MSYNMTFLNESTNIYQVIVGVNATTNNLLGALILLVIGLVLFAGTKKYDTDVAMLVTTFVLSVISLLMFTIQLIGVEIFVIPIILLIVSLFIKLVSK